jgi:hypothetical protein
MGNEAHLPKLTFTACRRKGLYSGNDLPRQGENFLKL